MPRKMALKPEVADGIREVGLGAHKAVGDDVTKAQINRNRRIRNRSYGGVGGRGPRGPLLPDPGRGTVSAGAGKGTLALPAERPPARGGGRPPRGAPAPGEARNGPPSEAAERDPRPSGGAYLNVQEECPRPPVTAKNGNGKWSCGNPGAGFLVYA